MKLILLKSLPNFMTFLFLLFQLSSISPEIEAYSELIYPMEEINDILFNISHRFKNLTNLPFFNIDSNNALEITGDDLNDATSLNITKLNFEVINDIIENRKIWRVLKASERLHLASTLLQLVTDLGSMLNMGLSGLSSVDEELNTNAYGSLLIQSKLFSVKDGTDMMEFNLEHARIELPFSALENSTLITDELKNISATVVLIRNMTSRLSTENLHVNSRIFSLVIEDEAELGQLNEPLRFRIRHLTRLEFFDTPNCAFWDFNSTSWSTEGCTYRYEDSTRYQSLCECDHVHSNIFALLTDVSQEEGSILAKSILTYIFSSITCLFLGLAVYILVEYQEVCKLQIRKREINLTKETNKVSLAINISIYLLLTHVFVMFGFNLDNRMLCNLNTIFQLFSVFATLSFMMLLSAHYVLVKYQMLDNLINFKYFNWIGYAIPTIIITVSLLYISFGEQAEILDSLAGEYFCWISSQKYPENMFIFIYPASGLILLTLLFCGSVLFGPYKCLNQRNVKFDLQLLNIVVLILNFGLPWIAYTLYINEYFGHFAYFFIFFNATQGIFFLTFQYTFYRINHDNEDKNKKIWLF